MGINVPQLRFPEFTSEWEEKRLGDIFTFYSTNSLSRDKLNNTGGPYKNIHYGDIHMIFPTVLNVSETEIPYVNGGVKIKLTDDNFVIDGDIAIADASEDYADIGKAIEIVGVGDEKLVCGLHTLHGRDLNKVMVNGFRGYLLRTPKVRRQMMTLCAGAKVLGISKDNINSVVVNIPSKEEQEKIKSLMVAYDKIIRNQKEKISTLQERKQGLLKKIFTQQVRFKDEDGNDYPAWEEKKLGDICEIVGGGTPATDNTEYWEGNIQWFTPTEIGHSKYVSKSERTITELGLNKSSAKLLPKGTILLTTRATLGEMSIAENECCTNQGFQSLIVRDGNIIDYVYYLQYIIKAFCLKYASGSTFLEISKNQLAKCKIPYMCIEEQKKIASFFSSFDKKIEIEQEILSNMQEFKRGLLQKMFI